jgi:hypothetical protein
VDHRRLIRFDPGWKGEGVSSSHFTPARLLAGFFYFDLLVSHKTPYLTEK